jgi:hypothetical protein
MKRQGELFVREEGDSECKIGLTAPIGIPLPILYLSFTFLFALLGFLVYMLWDFGIAGRVILFLVLVLILIHFAVFMAKSILDHYWPRR